MSNRSEPTNKPRLEDLLRLKRNERPDDHFWAEFERGMKQKQLAAIVEPKPWWLGYDVFVRRFSPMSGLGAGGLVAGAALFAFISLRSHHQVVTAPHNFSPATITVASVESPELIVYAPSTTTAAPAAFAHAPNDAVQAASITTTAGSSPLVMASLDESISKDARGVSSMMPESDGQVAVSLQKLLEKAALQVSALMSPQVSIGSTLGAGQVYISQTIPSRPVAPESDFMLDAESMDSLALTDSKANERLFGRTEGRSREMSSSHPRQARLLALASESGNETDSSSLAQVRDRVIHRMSEGESLYASISRLGVSGDRLSVKF